jgi:hypothetical protein
MSTTILSEEKRSLPCQLTESERAERGSALAYKLTEVYEAEEEEAERRKAEKASIDRLKAEARAISLVVSSGQEYRTVDVQRIADHDAGLVHTTRMDTGEVISTRDILPAERQLSLVGMSEGAVPAAE